MWPIRRRSRVLPRQRPDRRRGRRKSSRGSHSRRGGSISCGEGRFFMKRNLVCAVVAAIGLFAGIASAQPKADFTFVNRGEVGTLDPNRMSWLQDIRVGYALWEGLYTLDPQTLEPIPG